MSPEVKLNSILNKKLSYVIRRIDANDWLRAANMYSLLVEADETRKTTLA